MTLAALRRGRVVLQLVGREAAGATAQSAIGELRQHHMHGLPDAGHGQDPLGVRVELVDLRRRLLALTRGGLPARQRRKLLRRVSNGAALLAAHPPLASALLRQLLRRDPLTRKGVEEALLEHSSALHRAASGYRQRLLTK